MRSSQGSSLDHSSSGSSSGRDGEVEGIVFREEEVGEEVVDWCYVALSTLFTCGEPSLGIACGVCFDCAACDTFVSSVRRPCGLTCQP